MPRLTSPFRFCNTTFCLGKIADWNKCGKLWTSGDTSKKRLFSKLIFKGWLAYNDIIRPTGPVASLLKWGVKYNYIIRKKLNMESIQFFGKDLELPRSVDCRVGARKKKGGGIFFYTLGSQKKKNFFLPPFHSWSNILRERACPKEPKSEVLARSKQYSLA